MFGPANSIKYYKYEEWIKAVKAKGLMEVGCSSGSVAQDGPRGTCKGAWFTKTNRGWLEE